MQQCRNMHEYFPNACINKYLVGMCVCRGRFSFPGPLRGLLCATQRKMTGWSPVHTKQTDSFHIHLYTPAPYHAQYTGV